MRRRGGSVSLNFLLQSWRELLPRRVQRFDELELPCTFPALDLLLPLECRPDVIRVLEVHQPVDCVTRGERGQELLAMLIYAPHEVARDPNVQGAREAREDT